jgi:hypothetical protein
MSVHGAGLVEPDDTYVWDNLDARTFEDGANPGFDRSKITTALREYALAGVLHLDHFGALRSSPQYALMQRRADGELARALGEPVSVVAQKFDRLLQQHEREWGGFVDGLGASSFIRGWIDRVS